MEHMETTASYQTQGACKEFIIDRFSELPDEIAHHIVSFLTLRDLTRVSCVSKRWIKLYLSLPSLNFDTSSSERLTMWKRLKLFNTFDRFLSSRGDNKIQCFRIRWTYYNVKYSSHFDELYRIFTWIRNAIRCNVEVFDLQLDTLQNTPLALPSWFFFCPSLKSLLVDFRGDTLIWPSSSACFPNLRVLKLRKFKIKGEECFCKWILCSCKTLKELHLEEVRGIEYLTIESSSLESFSFVHYYRSELCRLKVSGEKVEDIHITWEFDSFDSSSRRSLHICAPNLKYLKWGGSLMDHTDLGSLIYVERAEILLEPKEEDSVKVFEALDSMRMVKTLILNRKTAKALSRECSIPSPFANISHLHIHIMSLSDDLVQAVASLLREMTTLSTLSIHSDPSFISYPLQVSTYNMSYWISQNLACIDRLEEVRIELSGANARELAWYILAHAKNLKKMVLLHSSFQLQRDDIWFLRKKKSVSTATVVVLNKHRSFLEEI